MRSDALRFFRAIFNNLGWVCLFVF